MPAVGFRQTSCRRFFAQSLPESGGVPWKSLRFEVDSGRRVGKEDRRSEIVILARRGGGFGAFEVRVQRTP